MAEYQAIYKCRLCGEEFTDSLISQEEIEKCLLVFEKGKTIYRSRSGRIDIYLRKGHYSCKNGSYGLADFQGFRKVE